MSARRVSRATRVGVLEILYGLFYVLLVAAGYRWGFERGIARLQRFPLTGPWIPAVPGGVAAAPPTLHLIYGLA